MDIDQTVSDLRREVAGLRLGIFLGATAILCFMILINLFVGVLLPPKFEKIFEDMLGSSSKLPDLTRWVIAYSRGAGGLLPAAVILSIGGFLFAWMNWVRNSWRMVLIAVAAFILLALHLLVLNLALFMPLIQIISGINEKSS
jgi:hypothetical protein